MIVDVLGEPVTLSQDIAGTSITMRGNSRRNWLSLGTAIQGNRWTLLSRIGSRHTIA